MVSEYCFARMVHLCFFGMISFFFAFENNILCYVWHVVSFYIVLYCNYSFFVSCDPVNPLQTVLMMTSHISPTFTTTSSVFY